MEKEIIELIKDEVNDDYSDDSLFNISSWGGRFDISRVNFYV